MRLRVSHISILAMLIAAAAPSSAAAQSMIPQYLGIPLGMPLPDIYFLNPAVGEVIEAAFAQPYGRVLADEFTAILSQSGDPACIKEKGIDKSQIAGRARSLLLRRGTQMYELIGATIDRPRYAAILAQREGGHANAELTRLRSDPVVQQFIAIGRPEKLADIAYNIAETIDRYSLIHRVKLVRRLTDSETLDRAYPAKAIHRELEAFLESNKSKALARYRELYKASRDALKDAIRWDEMIKNSPLDAMAGLDNELADLCVPH